MSPIFKTEIEKSFYDFLKSKVEYDENGAFFDDVKLQENMLEWFRRVDDSILAYENGIPWSVILQEKKLIDVFTQEYIDFKCNKETK